MKLTTLFTAVLMVCAFSLATAGAADQPTNAQKTCPVMGGTINKDLYVDYEGKRVYFCCEACMPTFKKDPAKYISKLEAEGVVLETVPTGETPHDHGHDHGEKPGTGK